MSDLVRCLYYDLSIGGKPLQIEELSLIESIKYEDVSDGSDLLTIRLVDPDFEFISSGIFVEEQTVTFNGGWTNERGIEFVGFISVIDVDFPDTGSPTLEIHCMDSTHLMNREKKKKTWDNIKHSDIASEIFASYGLSADVDDTGDKIPTVAQSDQTDIEFLISLADKQVEEYVVYVEGEKAFFKKKDILGSAQTVLKYREHPFDIASFSPRLNKEHKQEAIEHSDINSLNKEVDTAKATNDTPRDLQGKSVKTTSKKAPPKMRYTERGWVDLENRTGGRPSSQEMIK